VVLLEREQFLMELTRLFQKCGSLDSVFITLKKKGAVESFEPSDKCLLRPTDGKKISTMVSSKEVNKLYQAYWNLLRTNMDGLKKREKKVGVKEQSSTVKVSSLASGSLHGACSSSACVSASLFLSLS
uniref:Signal recognition particle 14 kDa protein n=1 Tax=Canis lupus dingo TaxID=286419 RepID=A0A8C0JGY4_CANLU